MLTSTDWSVAASVAESEGFTSAGRFSCAARITAELIGSSPSIDPYTYVRLVGSVVGYTEK